MRTHRAGKPSGTRQLILCHLSGDLACPRPSSEAAWRTKGRAARRAQRTSSRQICSSWTRRPTTPESTVSTSSETQCAPHPRLAWGSLSCLCPEPHSAAHSGRRGRL